MALAHIVESSRRHQCRTMTCGRHGPGDLVPVALVGHLLGIEQVGERTRSDPRLDLVLLVVGERPRSENLEEASDEMGWPAEDQTAAALVLQSTQKIDAGMMARRSAGISLPQLTQIP